MYNAEKQITQNAQLALDNITEGSCDINDLYNFLRYFKQGMYTVNQNLLEDYQQDVKDFGLYPTMYYYARNGHFTTQDCAPVG